jgi:hypothetical protein
MVISLTTNNMVESRTLQTVSTDVTFHKKSRRNERKGQEQNDTRSVEQLSTTLLIQKDVELF